MAPNRAKSPSIPAPLIAEKTYPKGDAVFGNLSDESEKAKIKRAVISAMAAFLLASLISVVFPKNPFIYSVALVFASFVVTGICLFRNDLIYNHKYICGERKNRSYIVDGNNKKYVFVERVRGFWYDYLQYGRESDMNMKNILCYGDSNTWGYDPITKTRYTYEERWTGILSEKLGSDYRVIEEGMNGRTTVFEDPIEEYRNGKLYLYPCLETHRPLDLVIIMLGTNDTKIRHCAIAKDIANGLEQLIKIIRNYGCGKNGGIPEMLVISPIGMKKVSSDHTSSGIIFGDTAVEKIKELPKYYEQLAKTYKCGYLNAADVAQPSEEDGIHMHPSEHKKLADAIYDKVKELIG